MDPNDIYELTALAQAELGSSLTSLTAAEIALLVRFDGQLTVRQVEAALSPDARKTFDANLRHLRDRRLLAPVEMDPFASRFHAEMSNLAALADEHLTEAAAAVKSLQRSGFFVQIARSRGDACLPPPGKPATVLVVEDEPVLARFIESYLRLSGMQVRVASESVRNSVCEA